MKNRANSHVCASKSLMEIDGFLFILRDIDFCWRFKINLVSVRCIHEALVTCDVIFYLYKKFFIVNAISLCLRAIEAFAAHLFLIG